MRIFITGGAGFIGSHSAELLVRQGLDVTILDNLTTGSIANLRGIEGKIHFIEGDIRDFKTLLDAMRGCEAVLHLAAIVSVPKSILEPQLAHEVNATGALHVLEAARETGIKRVVLASSAAIYGDNADIPLKETAVLQSLSPYAAQKWLDEIYSGVYAHLHGISPISLRYFNVFGPKQHIFSPYSGVLSRFIAVAIRGQPMTIHGDGLQTRDFVYVDDVAQANLLALFAPDDCKDTCINIGTGQAISVLQASEAISRSANHKGLTLFAEARKGDIRHSQADISRARQLLGYAPQVMFETGIARTMTWAREQMDLPALSVLEEAPCQIA
ncbi:MAG: NAD-dependent epimerase/dehydratase family protein [Cyanobacteria bacterium NC_groundwater_1444_Ag_S-0.65um_54_12]|nr:NAD-dependent epimerase/dehydratase family protein [Cyanobacteria bacterium NC_groundwater_1444_Ag_S-0.65um_54_12]